MYEYNAEVLSVYDGDTLRLRVDLGMDTFVKQSVRLNGIDTPEVTGKERPQGLAAKAFATKWLDENCDWVDGRALIRIETIKDRAEKYGRYLVVVWSTDGTNRCLNEDLVTAGHAIEYSGGART